MHEILKALGASVIMTITDLPEDILYCVISFLHPFTILRVRQLSKHFASLTRQRTVWSNVYQSSTSFLPDTAPSELDAAELERIVIRSYKLDMNWELPTPKIVQQRLLTGNPNKTPQESIKLYHGRYLMVGSRSSFVFYDLDADTWDQVIFGSGKTDATFTYYRANTDQPSEVSYISAVASTRWPTYTITKLHRVADVPIGRAMSGFAKITSGWLVHGCNKDSSKSSFNAVLFHIPTQYTYEVPVFVMPSQGDERIFQIDYIITESYIFLLYISRRRTTFEAFPLPDTTVPPIGTPLLSSTHEGKCPGGFTETSLVYSQPNAMRLIANAVTAPSQGMRFFDVELNPNGYITFSDGLHHAFDPGYNIHMSYSKNGALRGVCMAPTTFGLLRIDGTDEQLRVSDLGGPNLEWEGPPAYDIDFDGFRGRLCLVRDEGIVIMDFV
ncbi:hypothetical protein CPB85DRAFT_1294634 [Mucidula mucida]|nr:hypothetical protein CPB85DRAFT_1294634 [Mucidula mucida]